MLTTSTVRPIQRDLMLGVGLVGVFSLVMLTTVPLLGQASATGLAGCSAVALAVLLGGSAAAVALWHRPCRSGLVAFPLLVILGVAAMGALSDEVAVHYTGFFTLAVVYVGLTQGGRIVAATCLGAAPLWIACQPELTPSVLVRAGITFLVWMAVGVGLAHLGTRVRAEAAELLGHATTDQLTGLGNRVALMMAIDRHSTPANGPSSLILFDLDGFKGVNDMFGHAAGDQLLVEIAARLRRVFRAGDVAARLGGDEFGVLLPGTSNHQAAAAARRLLDALAQPVFLERGPMAVTASVGISTLDRSTTAETAVRQADLAMYEAKRGGRNRVSIFNQELSARRDAELELEADLRLALERCEFELHYQPLVHLQTGDVIGTEAFVRWNHPRYGLLTPDRFLPTVHALRSHTTLGTWILHEACRQAVEWQPADPGRALTMAVNVSPPEVLASGFVDQVHDAVTRAGLHPGLLVLEISERLAVSDAPAIRERIDRLRELGVRIAIDDFGTGHLSLTDLRDLPVDAVKIDNSLVEPLGQDTRANTLVRSMVAIAGALDFDIVVEGVETDTQVDLLVKLGCQVAQGYRFARPAPASVTGKLLTTSIDRGAGPGIGPMPGPQHDAAPRVSNS